MYFDGDWKDIRGEYDLSLKVLDEVYRYDEMDLEKEGKLNWMIMWLMCIPPQGKN